MFAKHNRLLCGAAGEQEQGRGGDVDELYVKMDQLYSGGTQLPVWGRLDFLRRLSIVTPIRGDFLHY